MRSLTELSQRKSTRRNVLRGAAGLGLGSTALAAAPGARFGNTASAADKPSSLNLLYATVEADVDAIKLVLADFKTATGIEINLDSQPYDALQQKAFAELASDSSFYDVMICDTPWTPALTGKLEPLSAYLANPALNDIADPNLADFIPKVFFDTAVYNPAASNKQFPKQDAIDVAAITAGGFEIYGLPLQANALTLSYRKDLFDKAEEKSAFKAKYGRDLAPPATWDEFIDIATFFTRPNQRLYGTTLMAGTGDWATDDFKTLLACWGGDGHMVTDDFKLAFNGPEGVAALQFYADLINKHKVTPPGVTSFSWDNASSTFGQGLAAMSMNYHTETLNPDVKGEIAYALVPKQVASGPHFGTWMLSVNKASKNKEWAYRAVTWLTSAATQTKMLQTQLHPTRASVYLAAKKDPSIASSNFYEILGQSLAVGVGRPRLTNYGAVDKEIWVAVNEAATGSKTPAAALGDAAVRVTAALKDAGYPAG